MSWTTLLNKVHATLDRLRADGCPDPFFRGHRHASWKLWPRIGREKVNAGAEARLYDGFRTLGGHLFRTGCSDWEVLFLMQHHGLPTRLLDWSESFAVALYFAATGAKNDTTVWILNPYKLNKLSIQYESVEYLETSFPEGYSAYFGQDRRQRDPLVMKGPVVSVAASRVDPRMQWQRAVFTLHADARKPIEKLFPEAVTRIDIPRAALPNARNFLRLAGINEASVFPELDGIARHLSTVELTEG